jgi:signal peptidase I
VQPRNGRLTVNGRSLVEPYLPADQRSSAGSYWNPTKLGADQFFVMGDDRSRSCDSREFGPIARSHILGEVIAIR